jgi:hypothetical protein
VLDSQLGKAALHGRNVVASLRHRHKLHPRRHDCLHRGAPRIKPFEQTPLDQVLLADDASQ